MSCTIPSQPASDKDYLVGSLVVICAHKPARNKGSVLQQPRSTIATTLKEDDIWSRANLASKYLTSHIKYLVGSCTPAYHRPRDYASFSQLNQLCQNEDKMNAKRMCSQLGLEACCRVLSAIDTQDPIRSDQGFPRRQLKLACDDDDFPFRLDEQPSLVCPRQGFYVSMASNP